MFTRHTLLQTACLVGLITLVHGGCTITVDPNDLGDGTSSGAEGKITIRIVNTTGHTLDPQIYLSSEPVDLDQLFTGSLKYTNYGVGLQGLIAKYTTDDFEIDCDQARVIGTLGGSFGGGDDDNDLNNPDGSGTQRVLTQELVYFCGDRITFTFRESAGSFTTTFDIDP